MLSELGWVGGGGAEEVFKKLKIWQGLESVKFYNVQEARRTATPSIGSRYTRF